MAIALRLFIMTIYTGIVLLALLSELVTLTTSGSGKYASFIDYPKSSVLLPFTTSLEECTGLKDSTSSFFLVVTLYDHKIGLSTCVMSTETDAGRVPNTAAWSFGSRGEISDNLMECSSLMSAVGRFH